MKLKDYVHWNHSEAILEVRIIPNASSAGFVGLLGENVLKIRLKSVPEKGKANRELLIFLSKCLGIPQKNITILSGESSQNKKILVKR